MTAVDAARSDGRRPKRRVKAGTIARSGTKGFLEALRKTKGSPQASPELPALIGQFGVGFYSAFMVADEIAVISRKAGEAQSWSWTSDGTGTYTIAPVEEQLQERKLA
jgi:molecular chaperone HtpG